VSGLLLTHARVATPLGVLDGWLRTEGSRIAELGTRAAAPRRGDAGGGLRRGRADHRVVLTVVEGEVAYAAAGAPPFGVRGAA